MIVGAPLYNLLMMIVLCFLKKADCILVVGLGGGKPVVSPAEEQVGDCVSSLSLYLWLDYARIPRLIVVFTPLGCGTQGGSSCMFRSFLCFCFSCQMRLFCNIDFCFKILNYFACCSFFLFFDSPHFSQQSSWRLWPRELKKN